MTWTAPRTWTDEEVPTASMLNTHIKDNLAVIKVTRDEAGRLSGLSSATLENLSPSALTGLANRLENSAHIAGKNQFRLDARVVIPVGADKYQNLGGGLRRGFWVEGDYLHHIAADQTTERQFLGDYVSHPAGAVHGSAWIEADDFHYIDADGDERKCVSSDTSGHSDAQAIAGSTWIETYLHWIREAGVLEKPGHYDVAHTDGYGHGDWHDDIAHADYHQDAGHADAHTDTHHDEHFDTVHEDHGDHHWDGENHDDLHEDSAYIDSHYDSHYDAHSDDPHGDGHDDILHDDAHDDHTDHFDTVHYDQPTVVA